MNAPYITQPPGETTDKNRPASGAVTLHTAIRWRRLGWIAALAGGLGLALWIAAKVPGVTIPLLVAFTCAYALNPVVDRFAERGVSRPVATFVLLTSCVIFFGAAMMMLGPTVWAELEQVPQKLQELLAQSRPFLEKTLKMRVPTNVDALIATLQREVTAGEEGTPLARSTAVLKVAFGGTVSILAGLGGLIMVPFFLFYLLKDYPSILAAARALIPLPVRPGVLERCREIDATLSAFIRGQLMVGGILAVLYALGFALVGLPLGLVMGIITGLGNMIPYVGTAVGLILCTLMALLSWEGWSQILLVYGIFVLNHVLEAWLITPKVVGGKVGLSPFAVIVAILVFGELFGFFGVLVAVPITATLKILLRVAIEHYYASPFFTGDAPGRRAEVTMSQPRGD